MNTNKVDKIFPSEEQLPSEESLKQTDAVVKNEVTKALRQVVRQKRKRKVTEMDNAVSNTYTKEIIKQTEVHGKDNMSSNIVESLDFFNKGYTTLYSKTIMLNKISIIIYQCKKQKKKDMLEFFTNKAKEVTEELLKELNK